MDSIGPRLTGSPANRAANDWLLRTYKAWGIDVKNEQYGTWRDWTRGSSGLELVAPRARVLEATMHAWSAATPDGGVTADVVIVPDAPRARRQRGLRALAGRREGQAGARVHAAANLPPRFRHQGMGRFGGRITTRLPRATALPPSGRPRFTGAHVNARSFPALLERAGAAGMLTNSWSRGWGVDKIQSARVRRHPVVRRLVRGLRSAGASCRRTGSILASMPSPTRSLAPRRGAGVQHDRPDHRIGKAE